MNDTKYAYASEDPHESPSFFALGSQGLPLRHASIMFGHDSPVAHLLIFFEMKNRKVLISLLNILRDKFSKQNS